MLLGELDLLLQISDSLQETLLYRLVLGDLFFQIFSFCLSFGGQGLKLATFFFQGLETLKILRLFAERLFGIVKFVLHALDVKLELLLDFDMIANLTLVLLKLLLVLGAEASHP